MNIRKPILQALIYHDIFKYPLNLDELKSFLTIKLDTSYDLKKTLKGLLKEKIIGSENDLYFLKNKYRNLAIRKTRNSYSKSKRLRANAYLKIIKNVPSVKLVAITGALAMNNSTKDDDIDFLIISSRNLLWTTRFVLNVLLFPFKRSPKSKRQNNKVCLNIFLDESDLLIRDQNIYTAHEIAQMEVIYDKENTYKNFLKSNIWMKHFLPNWSPESKYVIRDKKYENLKSIKVSHFTYFLLPLENFLKYFQLNYMKSKITTEKLSNTQLFFHPSDTQERVINEYSKRLKKLKIDHNYYR